MSASEYSAKQLWTIKNFGKEEYFKNCDNDIIKEVVNVGPMGVGKTRCIMEALGFYCLTLRELGYTNLSFALVGKTYNAIKRNMLNVLSLKFGNDFKYDHSTKDGVACDGRLFGFPLQFIPLNDVNSESRIRGLSDITGCVIDELTLISEETYSLILSRIRGGQALPPGYVNNWIIASTNPDSPSHWLLKNYIEKGLIKQIQWYCRDAVWKGFIDYINRLKRIYRHIPAFYERYILGRWRAAEGLVFSSFDDRRNVIDDSLVDYRYVKRTWISCDYGSNHKTSIQVQHRNFQGTRIISQVYEYERTAVSTIAQKILELYDAEFENMKDSGLTNYTINIYVDPAAQTLHDELRKNGLNPFNAKNEHLAGISYVNELFELCKLYIIRNEGTQKLIDEIYGYKYKAKENAKDGEVVKINDDHCDALRYGVYSDAKYNNDL